MLDQIVLQKEFEEVTREYHDLTLLSGDNGSWKIVGKLHFRGCFQGEEIEDVYSIQVLIPEDYPNSLPTVKELDGRIPKDFHTSSDDTLCLGTPLLIKMRFHERPNLLGFIESCLIEFFYNYNFFQKHKHLPVGEFAHGIEGIIEHYQELFGIENIVIIVDLLSVLANESYRGHINCVCESGKRLRNCHGKVLLELMNYQTPLEFQTETKAIISLLRERKIIY